MTIEVAPDEEPERSEHECSTHHQSPEHVYQQSQEVIANGDGKVHRPGINPARGLSKSAVGLLLGGTKTDLAWIHRLTRAEAARVST
jgi:hypothetical protein